MFNENIWQGKNFSVLLEARGNVQVEDLTKATILTSIECSHQPGNSSRSCRTRRARRDWRWDREECSRLSRCTASSSTTANTSARHLGNWLWKRRRRFAKLGSISSSFSTSALLPELDLRVKSMGADASSNSTASRRLRKSASRGLKGREIVKKVRDLEVKVPA